MTTSPSWTAQAACRTPDTEKSAGRVCRTCMVRRACLADDLASGLMPGGLVLAIDATDLDELNTIYVAYRTLAATWHSALLADAGRREAAAARRPQDPQAAGHRDAGRALRALAAAVADATDATSALATATAYGADPGEVDGAARTAAAAQALQLAAARLAGEDEPGDLLRLRRRLATLTQRIFDNPALVPTAGPVPVPARLEEDLAEMRRRRMRVVADRARLDAYASLLSDAEQTVTHERLDAQLVEIDAEIARLTATATARRAASVTTVTTAAPVPAARPLAGAA